MPDVNTLPREISPRQSDLKDPDAKEVEDITTYGNLSPEDSRWLKDFPGDRKKKAVWKVDKRLIPLLTLLYLFSFLDRANIGNANIEGLSEDLGLTGTQYNIALSIFFIPYVLCEVPSNYLLHRFKKPSLYIGAIVMTWGSMTTILGTVNSFSQLVAVRFLLGIAEAGFFPGAVLIVSKWYVRSETQTRIAVFYTASALAGAFSGLLAFGIAKMDGVGNYAGWRWIFILEGLTTVIAGAATAFLLIDSPAASGKWLDPDEIRYLELRQLAQNGNKVRTEKRGTDWKALRSVLCDWQIYLQALVYWSNTVPNNALKFTMPRIIQSMGFTSSNAQLLTIGPYCAGAISAYLSAVFSDRFTWRMPFIVGAQLIVVCAYSILFALADNIEDNIPACFTAVVLACIGNAGGIVGSYIFIEEEGPRYPTGFGTSLGFAAAGVAVCAALELAYHAINKRRDGISEEEIREKYSEDRLEEMGDRSPLFRYTL